MDSVWKIYPFNECTKHTARYIAHLHFVTQFACRPSMIGFLYIFQVSVFFYYISLLEGESLCSDDYNHKCGAKTKEKAIFFVYFIFSWWQRSKGTFVQKQIVLKKTDYSRTLGSKKNNEKAEANPFELQLRFECWMRTFSMGRWSGSYKQNVKTNARQVSMCVNPSFNPLHVRLSS